MPENFPFLTVSSPWSLLMTSDNEPLLFHPWYKRFPSYQKFLINHIIALDKGFRTHKTSKKHASICKSTEVKITVIKPLLILNHRHPLSLLTTAGKPLSYFLYLHLCIPWASSSTSHSKTRQEEQGGLSPSAMLPAGLVPFSQAGSGPSSHGQTGLQDTDPLHSHTRSSTLREVDLGRWRNVYRHWQKCLHPKKLYLEYTYTHFTHTHGIDFWD